jgi:hypothetical protein
MKALKRLILLVTALAVTIAMVPQALSQTPPPAQNPPPAQPPPPPPPAEEQHNTHPVGKAAVAGAAFGNLGGRPSKTWKNGRARISGGTRALLRLNSARFSGYVPSLSFTLGETLCQLKDSA